MISFDFGILALEGAVPERVELSLRFVSKKVLEFGVLGLVCGRTEESQLPLSNRVYALRCWCSADFPCSSVLQFRAAAVQLNLVCPPGTYQIQGEGEAQCQECPPGFYCPGGRSAELWPCALGSTSIPRSSVADACQCRRGFFWDPRRSVCLACAEGQFKGNVGRNQSCEGQCPALTTSLPGAVDVADCHCTDGFVDIDPSPEFNCTALASLPFADSLPSAPFNLFVFGGSLLADPYSSEDLLPLLNTYLGIDVYERALLSLNIHAGDIQYIFTSSEEELAREAHAKLQESRFHAWAFNSLSGELSSTQAINRTSVDVVEFRCPSGLDLPNVMLRSPSDCRCARGLRPQPAGLGCVKCPLGTYKDTVGDSSCATCPSGDVSLTTLREGATSIAACTCPAGLVSIAGSCEPCGQGFYCIGGDNRLPCRESTTTLSDTATSEAECVCAAGFLPTEGADNISCVACGRGTFKPLAGNGACLSCPVGTWSSSMGADSEATCQSCPSGSTTEDSGSGLEDFCVRPHGDQHVTCTSGQVCSVQLTGLRLREGHRLALTMSTDCTGAKLPVAGISNDATSKPATSDGNWYTWGNVPADFLPEGASYRLCWCSNMAGLACTGLESFHISAGLLEVVGPFTNHLFQCVRGQDCTDLRPFHGVGLSALDRVMVSASGCGGSTLPISLSNVNGSATLENLSSVFSLDFGSSDAKLGLNYGLLLDASEGGYDLCWCAGPGPCSPESALVPAGKLRVEGPNANQEISCSVGQPCALGSIQSVNATHGDRVMVLSACGTGSTVQGFPGGGVAEYNQDRKAFEFLGPSNLLLSPAGIFRLCFCRPNAHACDDPGAFRAPLGLMTAAGPFQQTTTCRVGEMCTLEISGIDLRPMDALIVTQAGCNNFSTAGIPGFPFLQQPLRLEAEGSTVLAVMGDLPKTTTPGTYELCWCPRDSFCTSTASFRATSGQLRIECPPGYFFMESRCVPCGRGFYCPGGSQASATRFPCPEHETTQLRRATTSSDCLCVAGYFFDSGRCSICSKSYYKADVSNARACNACPENFTTHATGSTSRASCIAASVDEGSDNSSAPESEVDTRSTRLDVPTMTFNVSLGTDWVDPDLRRQLIATLRRSIADSARMDPSAVQIILPWADEAGRRLSGTPSVTVLLKYPSAAEANRSAQETDISILVSDMSSALRQDAELSAFTIESTSAPVVSSVTITCPVFSARPPGVPILSETDCLCLPGYGLDSQLGSCRICPRGEYKSTLADAECQKCETSKSTVAPGAVSVQQCTCAAGLYEQNGECLTCEVGFFCNGTGAAFRCPENSTTIAGSARTAEECFCMAGYQASSAASELGALCTPCPSGRYKPNLGNEVCWLTCPANADSSPGSTQLADCYCLPDHVAELDRSGQLDRCVGCALFSGLVCPGGFSVGENGNHSQPRALEGWFQSGPTLAVQCLVVQPDGRSVCSGGSPECQRSPGLEGCSGRFGNRCAEGSAGIMCGECLVGWARSSLLTHCQPCQAGQGNLQFSWAVIFDLLRITVVNFMIAVLAAKGAGTSLKLHTCMIRIVQAWVASCSILLTFNLDRLQPFSWSQKQAESEAGCDRDCPVLLKFEWPQAVVDVMGSLFSVLSIMPRTMVNFAAECQAEDLAPDNPAAKLMLPSLYYLLLPVLTLAGTVLLCSFVVYAVVPLGNVLGIHFNGVDRREAKRTRLLRSVRSCLMAAVAELPAKDGVDDQQHEIGDVTGKAAGRVLTELAQGTLGKDTWNAAVPDDILAGDIPEEELLAIASHGIASERTLQRLVLGTVAWKHRGALEGEADRRSLPKADYLVEVANTARSALELEESLQKAEGEERDSLLCRAGQSLRLKADERPEVHGETERLDLGLFTARPGPWGLLNQSVPVIWLTQLALWPELMSKFLQMIRCMPVREDFGAPVTVQRLRSHPDVVCWQDEHLPTATIAMVGLVLWCFGTPLLLFLRIWSLQDRQEPHNRRRYGYFIQGLEPNYWYWELVVKRLDIGLMLLIASTSIANDDKAKLLLFALISGMQLAVTSWVKPYDNSQAEVLDFLEFVLLGARFLLFTIVAVLLIFFPSGGTVWVWSVSLLSMLVSAVVYSALHIIAQALRNVAGQMEAQPARSEQEQKIVISDLSHVSRRFINSDGVFDKLKQSTVAFLLPFLEPDSYLAFFWSLNADGPAIITRKSQIQGYRHRVQRSWLAKISTFLLRSSVAYQKEAVSKAYHDFIELWLSHFQGGNIPNVNVLCALAVACRALPDNVAHAALRDVWNRETHNLVKEGQTRWQLLADDFAKAVQMFALLRKDDANELMRSIEDLLKSPMQSDGSEVDVSVMEALTSEDDTLDFDALLDAGTAYFDTDSPAKQRDELLSIGTLEI